MLMSRHLWFVRMLSHQQRRPSTMVHVQVNLFLTLVLPDLESLVHRQNIIGNLFFIINSICYDSTLHESILLKSISIRLYCKANVRQEGDLYDQQQMIRSQQKQGHLKVVLCKEHKQKYLFVCLHKQCPHSFKIGCQKCRKDHGQHPNRLISIPQFHAMLSKPIRYIENTTAFKLLNLKKKVEYIRDFRTTILEKQMQLIENNQNIKSITSSILEEHYRIREVVTHIDAETYLSNHQAYTKHLQQCRPFLAFNPVKGDLVFNNQLIKNSRMTLEKYVKLSNELIDNIREFLVKIIQVLLANCTHEEDDDEIEFDNEDGSATSFNIFIKTRTDAVENPNIKNKIQNEEFWEMFDEEKDALNQEVNNLEKQITFKGGILNRIRSASNTGKKPDSSEKYHEEDDIADPSEDSQVETFEQKSKKGSIVLEKSKQTTEIKAQQEEYTEIIAVKDSHIKVLQSKCKSLQQKINELPQSSIKDIGNIHQNQEYQKKIEVLEQMNHSLREESKNQAKQISQLKEVVSNMPRNSQNDDEQKERRQELLYEINRLQQYCEKKDSEVSKHRKKYSELESLVEKMRENNAESEKELRNWRFEHEEREKKLRSQYQSNMAETDKMRSKAKEAQIKYGELQSKYNQMSKDLDIKSSGFKKLEKEHKEKQEAWSKKEKQIKEREKKAQEKQKQVVTKETNLKLKENESKSKRSQKTESSSKANDENKKIKEIKQMLQVSIKKNQELKDRIHQLQKELEQYKNVLKNSSKPMNISSKSNGRKVFCEDKQPMNFQQQEKRQSIKNTGLDKKVSGSKESAYQEIKTIFKLVSQDVQILEERLKEKEVIEKLYLKEFQRKRIQNKNLKKELDSIKLYGSHYKQTDNQKSPSPVESIKQKNSQQTSPVMMKPDKKVSIARKQSKNAK